MFTAEIKHCTAQINIAVSSVLFCIMNYQTPCEYFNGCKCTSTVMATRQSVGFYWFHAWQSGWFSKIQSPMFLDQMLVNTPPVLYALAIRVVYGFDTRLRGMCEVTPYMEATTACHCISIIYHTLQCYITYIPLCSALIFTSSVVHIYICDRIFENQPFRCAWNN